MAFYFKRPKPNYKKIRYLKRTRSKDGQEVLNRLNSFLSTNQKDPVEILCGFWEDQQNAISYQELRMAVVEGFLTEKVYAQWSQDYSHLVTTQLDPIWSGAIQAGSGSQPIIDKVADFFSFNMNSPGVVDWIHNRGSELVTNSAAIQREAINYFLDAKIREWYDPNQLARLIRPCVGLTVGQTQATKKLYDRTLEDLRKAHPRTKDSVLQKKALAKASQYAERAHRQRALTIAQTELAKAYNFGADESIRQAQDNYLIGKVIKRWNTAGDDNVCDQCHDLDGTEVGMEETFYDGNKIVEDGMFPPLHPRCACAIQYIEVEPPDLSFNEYEESRKHGDDPEYSETVADMDVIESNEYSKRYTNLDEDMNTVRSVRNTARDFVEHRSGTKGEDLAFIDSNTGKTLVNKNGVCESSCVPSAKMMDMLKESDPYTIIGLHNHPESTPPSASDIVAAIQRKYKYGIIAGHDGTIYKYEITDHNITVDDLNKPKLLAALNMAAREKNEALLAGKALTNVSTETYNELIDTFVRLEVL